MEEHVLLGHCLGGRGRCARWKLTLLQTCQIGNWPVKIKVKPVFRWRKLIRKCQSFRSAPHLGNGHDLVNLISSSDEAPTI